MIHNEFGWKTENGASIFAQGWIPKQEIKGAICLIHGLGEHSGRYESVAERLTSAGYAVFTFDHEGHGKSSGKRGHSPDYNAFMYNINKILACAKEEFPAKPLFIYGHSMGGNLAINYCLDYRPDIKGAVITSPWLKLIHPPKAWLVSLAKIADIFYPSFTLHTGLKTKDFAALEELYEEHKSDKLNHNRISIRTFLITQEKGEVALGRADEFTLPLFMAHGGEDKITSAEASKKFADKAKSGEYFLFRQSYHEIHNDVEKEIFFQKLISWLDKICG